MTLMVEVVPAEVSAKIGSDCNNEAVNVPEESNGNPDTDVPVVAEEPVRYTRTDPSLKIETGVGSVIEAPFNEAQVVPVVITAVWAEVIAMTVEKIAISYPPDFSRACCIMACCWAC